MEVSAGWRRILAVSCTLSLLCPSGAAVAGDGFLGFSVRHATPMEELAERLDGVERKVERYGSVVVKSPDVWGESRLMRHRSDVERQLRGRLEGFRFRVNALQGTRDAAILAQSLALQAALSPTPVTVGGESPESPVPAASRLLVTGDTPAAILPRDDFLPGRTDAQGAEAVTLQYGIEPVIELDQLNRYLQHLNELRRLNEGDDTADSPGYALNLIRIPVSVLPGRETERGYGAEVSITVNPYLSDELLPQVFRDLVVNGVTDRIGFEVLEIASRGDIEAARQALRRYYSETETEQTADSSPRESGASSRKPRSNGTRLLETWAQESLRNNAGLAGPAISSLSESELEQTRDALEQIIGRDFNEDDFNSLPSAVRSALEKMEAVATDNGLDQRPVPMSPGDAPADVPPVPLNPEFFESEPPQNPAEPSPAERPGAFQVPAGARMVRPRVISHSAAAAYAADLTTNREIARQNISEVNRRLEELARIRELVRPKANLSGHNLVIPPSHATAVNGATLVEIAVSAYDQLVSVADPTRNVAPELRFRSGLTYPALQSLLKAETRAACDFLAQDSAAFLWSEFCTCELADLIIEHRRELPSGQLERSVASYRGYRTNDDGSQVAVDRTVLVDPNEGIHQVRSRFFAQIEAHFPQLKGTVTASLAWHVLVESALLNEKLVRDMQEVAVTRNCPCLGMHGGYLPFYGPNPPAEARAAFCEYVRCRWPIHVFALDPVTQDQNISDSFSRRREMQLALAVAAANSRIGGQSLTQYARRLEYDLETIELNRTAVGFSHGENNFGWRFYPRVQSPPVESNARVVFRDLLVGGPDRDDDLRKRRLEPGMRECTALVVMPSFVPGLTVDVETDWFRLTGHGPVREFMNRDPGYADSLELSEEIVCLKRLSQRCMSDAHRFRQGDVFRLCKAVERLEQRLPLQTHHVSVPWENRLGGAELFNSGVTDLGPELHGWYGAPGVYVTGTELLRASARALNAAVEEVREAGLNLRIAVASGADADSITRLRTAVEEANTRLTAARATFNTARSEAANIPTTIFLTGRNFSVLDTQVIAGGVDVTDSVELISRDLMKVQIPGSASVVVPAQPDSVKPPQEFVVVHLATPYGATGGLRVPTVIPSQQRALRAAVDEVRSSVEKVDAAVKALSSRVDSVSGRVDTAADRYPTRLRWGLARSKHSFEIESDVIPADIPGVPFAFSPGSDGAGALPVVQVSHNSGAAVPFMDDEDQLQGADGQLAVFVTVTVGETTVGKPIPLLLGTLDDGIQLNGSVITARLLFSHIIRGTAARLPRADSVTLTVEGFVRFNEDQPVMRIPEKLTFSVSRRIPVVRTVTP